MEYDHKTPFWKHWYVFLEKHFTLIRYDQRGCGLSDRDITSFSFQTFVKDLNAVIVDAKVDRFHIMGISQGGAIALAYAKRYPQKVLSLIYFWQPYGYIPIFTRGARYCFSLCPKRII